jgi:hypothetical protein
LVGWQEDAAVVGKRRKKRGRRERAVSFPSNHRRKETHLGHVLHRARAIDGRAVVGRAVAPRGVVRERRATRHRVVFADGAVGKGGGVEREDVFG